MLTTILLVVLLLVLLGALPSWPYSRDWGYRPSGLLAIVLVVVVVLALTGHRIMLHLFATTCPNGSRSGNRGSAPSWIRAMSKCLIEWSTVPPLALTSVSMSTGREPKRSHRCQDTAPIICTLSECRGPVMATIEYGIFKGQVETAAK